MTKPTLVGESNPYGGDPRMALYPDPETSAGGRLCFKVLGMERMEYLRTFDRVNLCPSVWSLKTARARAAELRASGVPLVLLGAKVCHAFGIAFVPFSGIRSNETSFVVLPHPSGLCRLWNKPTSFERAQRAVEELLR